VPHHFFHCLILKMKDMHSSKTKQTWHHIPENLNLWQHCCEYFECHNPTNSGGKIKHIFSHLLLWSKLILIQSATSWQCRTFQLFFITLLSSRRNVFVWQLTFFCTDWHSICCRYYLLHRLLLLQENENFGWIYLYFMCQ
jgi:hypothetical protein